MHYTSRPGSRPQSGAVHLIALAFVIFLLVLAGVIYMFWQNNIAQNSATDNSKDTKLASENDLLKNENEQEIAKREYVTVRTHKAFSPGFEFTYPKDWKLSKSKLKKWPEDPQSLIAQKLVVISPSDDVRVVYSIHQAGGFSGTCGAGWNYIHRVKKTKLPNWKNAMLIESIYTAQSEAGRGAHVDGYRYDIFLSTIEMNQRSKVGDDRCKSTAHDGPTLHVGGVSNVAIDAFAYIELERVNNVYAKGDSVIVPVANVITDEFNKDEYKQAVEILLSTKKI